MKPITYDRYDEHGARLYRNTYTPSDEADYQKMLEKIQQEGRRCQILSVEPDKRLKGIQNP